MPWRITSPMYQRQRFVLDAEHTPASLPELCRRYGLSRKTGYNWFGRYDPPRARQSRRSPAPARQCPHATAPAVIREILQPVKPGWGARKLHELLLEAHPRRRCRPLRLFTESWSGMAGSAGGGARESERTRADRRRRSPALTWSVVDFKGQFRLGNGHYCYPLTVQDAYSRYLLACDGLEGPLLQPTQQVFQRLFRTYGLPARIRSDNGQPFASCALGRLSQLSVWWLRLGIRPSYPARQPPPERPP